MKLEELTALGLSDEQAKAVFEKFGQDIPKSRFDEVNNAKKAAEDMVSQLTVEISGLKKGQSKEFAEQVEKLKADYEGKMKQMKLDFAVDSALSAAGVRSTKAARALMNVDDLKLDGDKVLGLDDQIKTLKEGNDWLFAKSATQAPAGMEPAKPNGSQAQTVGTTGKEARAKQFKEAYEKAQSQNNFAQQLSLVEAAAKEGINLQ